MHESGGMYIDISLTEFWIGVAAFVGSIVGGLFALGRYWEKIQSTGREVKDIADEVKKVAGKIETVTTHGVRISTLENNWTLFEKRIERTITKSDFRELRGEVKDVTQIAVRAEAISMHGEKDKR